MVEELPGNSHRQRREPAGEEQAEKKLEKVVTGSVSRRKKPLGKKFAEVMFGGDGKGVIQYILMDVLLPAAKDTIADVVSQGIERALFGEARSSSRRTGSRTSGTSSYVSYNRYSGSPLGGRPREESRPELSRRARGSHDFDEIVLATRVEAEEVLRRMDELLGRYETVSVGDLCELVGVESGYTSEKWGWTDLSKADVKRVREGYLLVLPETEPLR